jgi:CHASE2 domain-containing sensor protein
MPDVFISLSSKDRAWGDWIAWQLSQAGYEVAYAYWQLRSGENLYARTEDWVHDSARVLVLMSANYFASEQTRRELDQAVSRDPSGRKGIVVPIQISDYDAAGRQVGMLLQIDLAGAPDETEARNRLLAGLSGNKPPAGAPRFPAGQSEESRPSFPPEAGGGQPGPIPAPKTARDTPCLVRRPVTRKFARGVGTCLLIQGVLLLPLINPGAEAVDDAVFQLPALSQTLLGPAGNTAYTFLDIDDDTYRAWGMPYPLRRDKLLKLLQYAVGAGARVVILDVELVPSGAQPDPLSEYLSRYRSATTPIVLVRSLAPGSSQSQPGACPVLDSAAPDSPDLFLASQSVGSKRDRVAFIPLWESVCHNGLPEVVPSVSLLGDTWLGDGARGILKLRHWLDGRKPADCAGCSPDSRPDVEPLTLNAIRLTGARGRLSRIRFVVSGAADARQRVESNGRKTDLLYTESARKITETDPGAVSPDLAKDRAVIIGGSFMGRDIKSTPLGRMPGAMVLINAMESLSRFGPLNPPGSLMKWPVIALWDMIVALWFTVAMQRPGILTWVVCALALLALSFAVAPYAGWSLFAIPLIFLSLSLGVRRPSIAKKAGSPSV